MWFEICSAGLAVDEASPSPISAEIGKGVRRSPSPTEKHNEAMTTIKMIEAIVLELARVGTFIERNNMPQEGTKSTNGLCKSAQDPLRV